MLKNVQPEPEEKVLCNGLGLVEVPGSGWLGCGLFCIIRGSDNNDAIAELNVSVRSTTSLSLQSATTWKSKSLEERNPPIFKFKGATKHLPHARSRRRRIFREC